MYSPQPKIQIVTNTRRPKVQIIITLRCRHQNDSALRWAETRAVLMFLLTVGRKVTEQCPQITIFEEKGDRNQTELLLLPGLTPYR